MDVFITLAEQKIQAAIRNGELDNLPLKGKPIPVEDLSGIPEELRMGYKILKNAGMAPEEVVLNKELMTLRDLLTVCSDPDERKELKKRLSEKQLNFDLLMERNIKKPAYHQYAGKLRDKLGL